MHIALRELAEAAQAVGVQLAIEPMHVGCSHDESFVNTIPQCIEIISQIGNPHLGLVFDCYHLAQNITSLAWLESIVPYVRLIQLGDARHAPLGEQNRCMLGHGCVPLPGIIDTFQEAGFQGFYEVELHGRDVADVEFDELLGHMREFTAGYAQPASSC